MDNLSDNIKQYLTKNKITLDDFAKDVKIDKEKLDKLLLGEYSPSEEEITIINKQLSTEKLSKGKKIVKAIELILKFGACIMALVTLLLCIMGNVEVEILIALLSVGVVCETIPLLPKIDK